MNSTYILGAGFSRAVSASMPLLTELGRRVREGDPVLYERVQPYEIEQFESWMSQALSPQPYRSSAENLEARGLYLRAARQIGEILREEVVSATSVSLPHWLQALAEIWHSTRATVSTFNYDTLVEIAARRARLFDPDARVIVPWPTVINFAPGGHASLTFSEDGRDAAWRSFDLLKLHGSINWYWVPEDDAHATLERVPLYDAEYDDELRYDPDRWVPGKEPNIVPPVALKSSFYGGAITTHLWRKASESLRRADEIVIMGYSVPMTDLTTLGLFRESLANKASVRIVICDLDPAAVVERISRVLPPDIDVTFDRYEGLDAVEQFTSARLKQTHRSALGSIREVLAAQPQAHLGAPGGERQLRQVLSLHAAGGEVTCRVSEPFHASGRASDPIVYAGDLLAELDGANSLKIAEPSGDRTVWGVRGQNDGDAEWLVLSAGLGGSGFRPV